MQGKVGDPSNLSSSEGKQRPIFLASRQGAMVGGIQGVGSTLYTPWQVAGPSCKQVSGHIFNISGA